MEPSLALQKLIGQRLANDPAVTNLVPPASIVDRHQHGDQYPCIVLGEGAVDLADGYATFAHVAVLDVHVWSKEPGLRQAKEIAQAAREAILRAPWNMPGFRCHSVRVLRSRFLRDPSGDHAHAVLIVEAIMQEVTP